MSYSVYQKFLDRRSKGLQSLAILIDPDIYPSDRFDRIVEQVQHIPPDAIMIGGSMLSGNSLEGCLEELQDRVDVPLILFPGGVSQIDDRADALLFLSLISGHNSEYLIGQQVKAAPMIRDMKLEAISTGYILIDGGAMTTAHYMSQSMPVPHDKPDIAANIAIAGEMLGMKCIYLDTGSGAKRPVSQKMIETVRNSIDLPLIVGGGIRDSETVAEALRGGADIVVVGNVVQENPELLEEMILAVRTFE